MDVSSGYLCLNLIILQFLQFQLKHHVAWMAVVAFDTEFKMELSTTIYSD